MKKVSAMGLIQKKCDSLMQEVGKLKYPKSIVSGKPTEVMHHYIPKSVASILRYDWDNLIPLTHAEHCRIHQSEDPTIENQILFAKGGKDWEFGLQCKRNAYNKVNKAYYENVLIKLQDERKKF